MYILIYNSCVGEWQDDMIQVEQVEIRTVSSKSNWHLEEHSKSMIKYQDKQMLVYILKKVSLKFIFNKHII